MRKKPLTFEAVVRKCTWSSEQAPVGRLKTRKGSCLATLAPAECDAPSIPRALLACLKPGELHRVRITVERIEDE